MHDHLLVSRTLFILSPLYCTRRPLTHMPSECGNIHEYALEMKRSLRKRVFSSFFVSSLCRFEPRRTCIKHSTLIEHLPHSIHSLGKHLSLCSRCLFVNALLFFVICAILCIFFGWFVIFCCSHSPSAPFEPRKVTSSQP